MNGEGEGLPGAAAISAGEAGTATESELRATAAPGVGRAEPAVGTSPRTLITPHCAGWSGRFWERCTGRFIENLELYLANRPLLGVMDFARGY